VLAGLIGLLGAVPVTRAVADSTGPTTTVSSSPTSDPTAIPGGGLGEVTESWGLAPGDIKHPDAIGSRSDLSYLANAGTKIDDAITLYNYGTVDMTFRVYATDAIDNAQGKFDLLGAGDKPTDVGSWVKLVQNLITVPAHHRATIPFTLTIPADARPGDHPGGIVAGNDVPGIGPGGKAIVVERRTGTRLNVRVNGGVNGSLRADLAITDLHTAYHQPLNPLNGSATVRFRVVNRGNVRLGGRARVSVSGLLGLGKHTVTLPAVADVLPGQGINVTATVDHVVAAVLTHTEVRLVPDPAGDAGVAKTSTVTNDVFTPPWGLALVLLIVLFALAAVRAYRKHRRAGRSAASPATPTVGETAP
jgi:hypothetical protein